MEKIAGVAEMLDSSPKLRNITQKIHRDGIKRQATITRTATNCIACVNEMNETRKRKENMDKTHTYDVFIPNSSPHKPFFSVKIFRSVTAEFKMFGYLLNRLRMFNFFFKLCTPIIKQGEYST